MFLDGNEDEESALEVFELTWGSNQSASRGGGGGMPQHTNVTIKVFSANDPQLYHWSMDSGATKQVVFKYYRGGMLQRTVTINNAFCVSYQNHYKELGDDNVPNVCYDQIVLSLKPDALNIS